MNNTAQQLTPIPFARLLFIAGVLVLSVHPVLWLTNTWVDPSYDSAGIWVFLGVVGLLCWSVSSPVISASEKSGTLALVILSCTSLFRLISQVLAINILGAMALVFDVYAVGHLFQIQNRGRSLSPFWLAVLFALSLPLTNIMQRTIGFGLQQFSATSAGALLKLFFENIHQEGVRIILAGQDVMIDLPCSGAQCLVWLIVFYTILVTLKKPTVRQGLSGIFIAGASALLANTVRIVFLAIGIAFPPALGSIDVMAHPWHDIIGLLTFMLLGCIPLLIWVNKLKPVVKNKPVYATKARSYFGTLFPFVQKPGTAACFLLAALWIVNLPHRPVDVSTEVRPVMVPSSIGQDIGQHIPLSDKESAYFTQYGGQAVKRQYGNHSLLVVRTSAPLRHLHNPGDCLRGLGFDVQYLGMSDHPIPTAVYKATSPDKSSWRVAVTFVSSDGQMATSVSEAVWYWLRNPGTSWTSVQRISPDTEALAISRQWDRSVALALDIPTSPESRYLSTSAIESVEYKE